ncbi:MAG: DUF6788 family protein [Acidimicrobiales bacterium]|jgi:hypothetical protein
MDESLVGLEERGAELYRRLSAIGDFRRGSITENHRRCGKANRACAQPDTRLRMCHKCPKKGARR